MMETTSSRKLALSWLALILLTGVSWLVSGPIGLDLHPDRTITLCVVAAAAAKCYLIMRNFMDVPATPLYMRIYCGLWLVGLTAGAVAIYTLM